MKLFFKKDIVIILLILLLAFGLFYFMRPDSEGMFYEISINSETAVKESLFNKKRTILDCGAVIVCDGKSVSFESSDCPDKVCVNTGKLTKDGEWAACLPNKVFLKVTGESQ